MNLKYWPRKIEGLEPVELLTLIQKRRELIRLLSPDLQAKASELFFLAELEPARARFRLYNFLCTRLDQVPILTKSDQQNFEVLIESLLPEN